MGSGFVIFDIISILAGIFLIVAPEKAFYFGKTEVDREQRKMPKSWPITSRVIGVLFILVGLAFIYVEFVHR